MSHTQPSAQAAKAAEVPKGILQTLKDWWLQYETPRARRRREYQAHVDAFDDLLSDLRDAHTTIVASNSHLSAPDARCKDCSVYSEADAKHIRDLKG